MTRIGNVVYGMTDHDIIEALANALKKATAALNSTDTTHKISLIRECGAAIYLAREDIS